MNNSRILAAIGLLAAIVLILVTYGRREQRPPAHPIGRPMTIAAPLGLPPVPTPADNPPTVETVSLGRRLYYDPALSVDGTVSCATCHDPERGFGDAKRVSDGVGGKQGTRNSPTVLNSAYFESQFWDGRAPSLEKQAEGPVQNPVEMAHTLAGVERKLMGDEGYRAEFRRAFGPGPIAYDMVAKAIASFERTVIAGNSPFDRYYFGGDKAALSPAAVRGFEIFRDPKKGNCVVCHTINNTFALFTDNKFHNIGVGAHEERFDDAGRFDVSKDPNDRGAFKTPSLRNVAQTAPYFHDGSRKTLKEVLDFYIGGGNSNPNLSKEVHALDYLSGQERADLLAFLESLTGEVPDSVKPPAKTQASLPQH